MDCARTRLLIENVPLRRWTPAQHADVQHHVSGCKACAALLVEQQALVDAFGGMAEPVLSREISVATSRMAPGTTVSTRYATRIALALLILGGIYFLPLPELFALPGAADVHWLVSRQRIDAVLEILTRSPLVSIGMIVVALVYACAGDQSLTAQPPRSEGERAHDNR